MERMRPCWKKPPRQRTAPQEEAWTKLRAEKSSGQILEEICKVGREEIIFSDIMNYIDRFEEILRTGNRVPGAMYHL